MKTPRLIPLLTAVCLLGGCASQKTTPAQEKHIIEQTKAPFEATAHMTFEQIDATVSLQKSPDLTYHLSFQEPPPLKGLEVDLTEEKAVFRYRGLELQADPAALSSSAAVRMLASALEGVAQENGLTFAQEEGRTVIQGEADGNRFNLTLDSKNGNFLSLAVPDSDFTLEFTGFRFF